MAKTAIVLGATGAVGTELVKLLVNDERYSQIKLFLRKSLPINSPKVEQHIINLLELEKHKADFTGNEVFCCIGTTKAKTPDKETYHKIDYGIPVTAARLANENNIATYIVISAIGADKNSSIFYSRTKGEMQEAVLACHIKKTHLLQPSLIVAHRNETRIMEKIAAGAMAVINPLLIRGAKKYKSLKAEKIARAMVQLANSNYPEVFVQADELARLAE